MIIYEENLIGIAESRIKGFCARWKDPLPPEKLLEILQSSYKTVLAIDDETNNVIGFVNALSDKIQFAFIPMIEVLPDYRNKGIGTTLMRTILSSLKHIDCIDLTCDPGVQSFYEGHGMLKSSGMVIRRYLSR